MSKKLILLFSILASIFLLAIGFFFYRLYNSSESTISATDSRIDALNAVPSDAIMVYEINDFADLRSLFFFESSNFSKFINAGSSLGDFIKKLPGSCDGNGAVLSLHYSSKNRVSLLFILSLPREADRESLAENISGELSGVSQKIFDNSTIFRSSVPDISYSFYDNYLIASTSVVVVESSLRHLDNKTSIIDNEAFATMSKSVGGRESIHLCHQNIGKLFSGGVANRFLKYSSFFSSFTGWSSFELAADTSRIDFSGKLLNTKDEANYSNIFLSQKNSSSTLPSILPYNTNYYVTLPLHSSKTFIESYSTFLEAKKRYKDYSYTNAMLKKKTGVSPIDWFNALGVKEIAAASVPVGDSSEKVILIRAANLPDTMNFNGYISAVMGDLFQPDKEESFSQIDEEWIIVGSKTATEKCKTSFQNPNYFSLEEYILQTPAASLLKGESSAALMVNLSRCSDSLGVILKKEYARPLLLGIEENNFNLLEAKLVVTGGNIKISGSLFAENLAQMPKPKINLSVAEDESQYADIPVEIPEGPFPVKNYVNGKTNYLQQQSNNILRLTDENKKGVWSIPFPSPICGYVEQIDLLKNNKLQMLVATGTKLYLIDRLGRIVKKFPVDLGKEILLGPKVYDLQGDKNYFVQVLHTDNSIGCYTLEGVSVKNWEPITGAGKILSLPELLTVGNNNYWVVKTPTQTLIYNINGAIVADFTKKKRLRNDTSIEIKSSNEVIVTTIEDKKFILNLENGSFKKYNN